VSPRPRRHMASGASADRRRCRNWRVIWTSRR
jgi:hypothetical protein